ncbi:MAG: hypothetical protein HYX52_00285 [Chloroflexi bacterium]|nr:hypothetical protein [Chloroflexota bacterium]
MQRVSRTRMAGYALVAYGLAGAMVTIALISLGTATFRQLSSLRGTLDQQRSSLSDSLRVVSRTIATTASATSDVQASLDGARRSAESASALATNTAYTFRGLAQASGVQVFGLAPFAAIGPQLEANATQMDDLSTALAATGTALRANQGDAGRVGQNLQALRTQVDTVAATIDRLPAAAFTGDQGPLETLFYGMCILFAMQSIFSLLAGAALVREQESLKALAELVALHREGTKPGVLDGRSISASSPAAPAPGSTSSVRVERLN